MDLQDQLRNFFPNHKISENSIPENKNIVNFRSKIPGTNTQKNEKCCG